MACTWLCTKPACKICIGTLWLPHWSVEGVQVWNDTLMSVVIKYFSFGECNNLFYCAGVFSWAVITPIDLVKSRIQADDIKKPMYRGVVDCAKKSYQAHGLPVFFRGFSMMMVRSFPVNAATFLVYESSLHFLKPDMDPSDLGLIDPWSKSHFYSKNF